MGRLTRSDVSGAFQVSNVYNGALVGPLMFVGSLATTYYIPYGMWSIWTPLVSMGIFGIIWACCLEFPRHYGCQDYIEVSKVMYGKYSKICTPIIDVYQIISYFIGLGIYLAIVGPFMHDLFGIPDLLGIAILAVLALILTMFYDKVVRFSATIMTVAMLAGAALLGIYIFAIQGDVLAEMFRSFFVPEGSKIGSALYDAAMYGLASCGAAVGYACISQPIKKKGQNWLVCLFTVLISGGLCIITNMYYVGFIPEILSEASPAAYVLNTYIYPVAPYVVVIYSAVMLFALVSSLLPNLFILSTRFDRIIPNKGIFANHKTKYFIMGLTFSIIATISALTGLQNLLNVGLGFLSYVGMPLIAIPAVLIWPIIHYRRDKAAKLAAQAGNAAQGEGSANE